MVNDEELDALEKSKEVQVVATQNIAEPVIETDFSKKMDIVKENILVDASEKDEAFVTTVKENVKQAAVTLTEVEKDKAKFQQQQVSYESEKLATKQGQNKNQQNEDKWTNKQKRRQFHYDGVAPILQFVGIDKPMNLIVLYLFVIVLTPIFLVAKFIKGTFGTLLAGASDDKRGKTAKGFLWTLLCLVVILTVICLVYLFLKWQGIDLLANIKNKI